MTNVNWTKQLVLSALLLTLGMGAYWLEFKHKPEQEDKTEQTKKVFQVKDTPVQGLKLVDPQSSLSFVCVDFASKLCKTGDVSKWEITEPTRTRGDDSNLKTLLGSVASLMTTESFDLTSETPEKQQELLKEYGLDASKRKVSRRVEVSTGSGKQTLYLGEVHPVGGSQFALLEKTGADGKTVLDETKVLLIPGHFKSAFDHDFTYWRNKKIFSMSAHEVTRFDLQGSYGPIHGKRVNGIWTLDAEGEKDLPGDIEAIDSLLTGSTYLVARKFISENKNDPKAKAALQGFSHVVDLRLTREKVETPKGESKTPHVEVASVQLTLYKKEKKGPKPTDPITSTVYATVSNLDPLFELDSYSKERVNKSLKELRLTKLISSMDRFGAKKVEFSGAALGGKSLILENSGGKWKLPHIKTDLAPEKISEKLQDTLERLSGNRIQEFFKGRDIPVGEENGLTFTLHGEKDAVQRQLLFWKKNNRLFGKDLLHRRDEAFLVDNSITDALPWSPDYFSKKNETNSLEKSDKTKE